MNYTCPLCSSLSLKEIAPEQLIELENKTVVSIQMYKLKCKKCIWISASLPELPRPKNSKIVIN